MFMFSPHVFWLSRERAEKENQSFQQAGGPKDLRGGGGGEGGVVT